MKVLVLCIFTLITFPTWASHEKPLVRCGIREIPLCDRDSYSYACRGRIKFMVLCEVSSVRFSKEEALRELNSLKEELETIRSY